MSDRQSITRRMIAFYWKNARQTQSECLKRRFLTLASDYQDKALAEQYPEENARQSEPIGKDGR
jgi:t-SNARE complex subunit (syntaxin)